MAFDFNRLRTDQLVRLQEVGFDPSKLELDELEALLESQEDFSDFTAGMQRAYGSAKLGIAGALGSEDLADSAQRDLEEVKYQYTPDYPSFKDVENPLQGIEYISELGLASLPQMAVQLGSGIVGTRIGGPRAGIGAATAAGTPFFAGMNIDRQMEEQGIDFEDAQVAKAYGTGVVQSALDSLIGKAIGIYGTNKAPAAIAAAAKKGFTRRTAEAFGKGALIEAPTETAQQALEIFQANPEKFMEFPEEVQAELMEAAVAGGLLGGTITAPTGFRKPKDPIKEAEEDLDRHLEEEASLTKQMEEFASARAESFANQEALGIEDLNITGLPALVDGEEVQTELDVSPRPLPSPDSLGRRDVLGRPSGLDVDPKDFGIDEEGFADPRFKPRKVEGELVEPDVIAEAADILALPTQTIEATLGISPPEFSVIYGEGPTTDSGSIVETIRDPSTVRTTDTTPPPAQPPLEGELINDGDLFDFEAQVEPPSPVVSGLLDSPTNIIYAPGPRRSTIDQATVSGAADTSPREITEEITGPVRRRRISLDGGLPSSSSYIPVNPFNDAEVIKAISGANGKPNKGKLRARLKKLGLDKSRIDKIVNASPEGLAVAKMFSTRTKEAQVEEAVETAKSYADYAALEEQYGSTESRKEFDRLKKRARKVLAKKLRSMGLGDVSLRIEDVVADPEGGVAEGVAEIQRDGDITIALSSIIYDPSLTEEQLTQKITEVMNHETIHALRGLGVLSDAEFSTLVKAAKNQKFVDKSGNERKFSYFDRAKRLYGNDSVEVQEEESVAELFRDWAAGRKSIAGKPQSLFRKIINFFKGVSASLESENLDPAEIILRAIQSGEVGVRPRRAKGSFEPSMTPSSSVPFEEDQFSKRYSDTGPKVKANGEVVGAPPNARTVQDRTNLVRRMTKIMEDPYALIDSSKEWYERSGKAIRDITQADPVMMDKVARLMSLYSQGNSVGANTTATVKSLYQLATEQMFATKQGEVVASSALAGRFPLDTLRKVPELLAAENFDQNIKGVSHKLENFYRNLIDGATGVDNYPDASTQDTWMMRLFGYKVGKDNDVGGSENLSSAQYAYAKDLMDRIVRAWERKTGEALLPRQVQAVLWTYIKNKTDYERLKTDAQKAVFEPKDVDFSDYLTRATANVTWESRPSESLPLLSWIHDAPRSVQEEFNEIARGIITTPDGKDMLMELLGGQQLYNGLASTGAYEGMIAPNVISKIVLRREDNKYVDDIATKYAAILGYIMKQDAVPWYRPDVRGGRFDSVGYDVTLNIELTQSNENDLIAHLESKMPGIGYTKVGSSLQFINFRDENGKPFLMNDKKYKETLGEALRSYSQDIEFDAEPFRAQSQYISNDWKENPNGEGYVQAYGGAGFADIQATVDGWANQYLEEVGKFDQRKSDLLRGAEARRESTGVLGEQLAQSDGESRQAYSRRFGLAEKVPLVESGRSGPDRGKISIRGVHRSNIGGITELDSSRYGEGVKGEERERLELSSPISKRIYFYGQSSDVLPTEESLLSSFSEIYTADLQNIYNPIPSAGGDPYLILKAKEKTGRDFESPLTQNAFEELVLEEGFDGWINYYFNPSPAITLLGDIKAPVRHIFSKGNPVDDQDKGSSEPFDEGPKPKKYSKRFSSVPSGNPEGFRAFANNVIAKDEDTGPFTGFFRKALGATPNETLRQAFVRNNINRFLPGYLLDEAAYGSSYNNPDSVGRMMEMSQQVLGRIQALMEFGPVKVDKGGNVSQISGTDVKGLNEIFAPLLEGQTEAQAKENERQFYAYAVAKREKALRAVGRKGFLNISDAEIDRAIGLAPAQYETIFKNYQAFNNEMVKFAKDSGLMNDQMADEFSNMAYVPFYRELETAEGDTDFSNSMPMRAANSLMKPGAFDKKLLGSNFKVSADLLQNIYRNNEMIISAGLRNIAMQKTAQALEKVNDPLWGARVGPKETGPQIMKLRVDGEEVRYRIDDAALWHALSGLTPQQKDAYIKVAERMSNILRMGVTNMPGFMIANLWRGKIDAYVKAGVPLDFGLKTIGRMNESLKGGKDAMAIKLLTGFGGYAFGADPSDFAKVARRVGRTSGSLAGEGVGVYDSILNAKQALETFGEATEMEVRIGLYQKLIQEGVPEREAAFQAMNLINYGRRGAGGGVIGQLVVNRLIPAIPFLNARIQGLYRLAEQPQIPLAKRQEYWKAMMMRGLLVSSGSAILGALAMGDDRWDEESPENKLNYDIIYIGDKTIKIPRAFEIGAVFGAFPVFFLDAIRQKDGTDMAKAVAMTFSNTFAFNPIPQAVKPLLEVVSGYDFFRMAPIEGLGLQRKQTSDRYYESTPEVYKFLSRYGGDLIGLSPLEIQKLMEGYLSGMATVTTSVMDSTLSATGVIPSKPNGVFGNPYLTNLSRGLGLTRFIQVEGEGSSQFVKEFYQMRREADSLFASMNDAASQGDNERVNSLLEKNKVSFSFRKTFNRIASSLTDINNAMKAVTRSPDMGPIEKTEILRRLRIQKNKLARRTVEIAEAQGY